MRYEDIDREALQAAARIRQYRLAYEPARQGATVVPSDIELAIGAIREAITAAIGPQTSLSASHSTVRWEIIDPEDSAGGALETSPVDGDIQEEGVEQSAEATEIEQAIDRRWSQAARVRNHWRSFIDRFTAGLASPSWQALAGTAVLSANYDIFSHVLQRLHVQTWLDTAFNDRLIGAQTTTHRFAWGDDNSDGWLATLPDDERALVASAFSQSRLAVRLMVDLAGCATLAETRWSGPADAVNRYVELRQVTRAVLTFSGRSRRSRSRPCG
jgi:hypothetical protein